MLSVTAKLITSTSQLEEIIEDLLNSQYLAVDTETTGLGRFAEVIGLALAIGPDTSYYIPIKIYNEQKGLFRPWSDQAYSELVEAINVILTKSKRILTHNGTFDAKVIENTFGINILDNILADTQLLHHTVVDESPPHGLKDLAVKYLDPEADSPQEDLKESVLANGGRWTKKEKDFWKGDWKLLGHYACHDVIYTYRLFELWYPELLKNETLLNLWNEEVMPLLPVTYDLNTVGVKIDVDYFKNLELSMLDRIKTIEDEIYASISDKIKDYELQKLKEEINITPRSEFGKFLKTNELWPWQETDRHYEAIRFWYDHKNSGQRIFNLDSPDDKAFLLFDVLKLPVKGTTAKGKRSVTKAILDELADEFEESSDVLKLIRQRSKELKLLGTYVRPIIETNEGGRIYPSFNQTGTTSGRYSCGGNSINMQTLPRDDHRIKQGFIAEEGQAFVAADFASLEPHIFAYCSSEPKLKNIFKNNLDFYSTIAIDVLDLKGVSADPSADNYLGTVDKAKRNEIKAIALSIPYGVGPGRLAQLLKSDYEYAKDISNKYLKAYPNLKKWMDKSDLQMKMRGYVESLVGRRKRNKTITTLYNKYKIRNFSKESLASFINRYEEIDGITDYTSLYLECRNALNVAKNHQIQSLAASVCNQAMIDFKAKAKESGLDAKLILQVHDEIVVTCAVEQSEEVAALLKDCMIKNRVASMIDVPLDATPVITDKNLAEAK